MILTPFLSNFVQEYQIGPFLLACYELYFEETQSSVAKFMLRKMFFVGEDTCIVLVPPHCILKNRNGHQPDSEIFFVPHELLHIQHTVYCNSRIQKCSFEVEWIPS
jgi:hypothetical protein